MSDGKFYFNTKTNQVEGEEGGRAADRLGPYDTAEEASRAYEIAREKSKAWDDDPDWNDDAPSQSGSGDES